MVWMFAVVCEVGEFSAFLLVSSNDFNLKISALHSIPVHLQFNISHYKVYSPSRTTEVVPVYFIEIKVQFTWPLPLGALSIPSLPLLDHAGTFFLPFTLDNPPIVLPRVGMQGLSHNRYASFLSVFVYNLVSQHVDVLFFPHLGPITVTTVFRICYVTVYCQISSNRPLKAPFYVLPYYLLHVLCYQTECGVMF